MPKNELTAELRNKLQAVTTILDFLEQGKKPSKKLIDQAKKDLANIRTMVGDIPPSA